jgi:hypothetical protein
MRAGTRHVVKTQLGPGGDDEVVVGQRLAFGEFQLVALGVDARDRLRRERQPTATQGLEGTNWK